MPRTQEKGKPWTLDNGGPDDLLAIFKDYQIMAIDAVYDAGERGAGSGPVWVKVNERLEKVEKSISRASIIFFLNRCVDNGVFNFRDATGKGGHHRIYHQIMDRVSFDKAIAGTFYEKLARIFPGVQA